MAKGRRYDDEQKLNGKKVFAVVTIILMIIIFIIGINTILKKSKNEVSSFNDISYFTSYSNGKWGVINSKGENIIEPTYDEMVVVPNYKKAVFICMYDVNYKDGTYKIKAVNSKNEQLYTNYENVEALSNYDKENNIWYEENILKVKKDNKFGLIDIDGNEILPCEYDKIDTVKGVKNSIIVGKGSTVGIVNSTGSIVIDVKYADIKAVTTEYKDGYIVKDVSGNLGIILDNNNSILDCKYNDIKNVSGNNLFVVKENGKWKILDKESGNTIDFNFEDAKSIENKNIIVKSNNKYGLIASDGTVKIKCEYQNIDYAFSDNYICEKDNKYGIINSNGEVKVQFEYENLKFNKEADCIIGTKTGDSKSYLIDRNLELKVTGTSISVSDGYIRLNVDGDYKFYNLKFEEKTNKEVLANNTLYVEKKDGKYGLVNKNGTLVVKCQYDDITEQNKYGYVAVKKDGKWGIIDQYGNTVIDPKYQLLNESLITVIGKWYKAENVNTTYYICE